jgi:hypothetical protein
MCAKALLFNTRADCFRAGLIVGKLLNHNGDKTRQTLSDSPTLLSVGLEAGKPLGTKVNTGKCAMTRVVPVIIPYAIDYKVVSAEGIEPSTY